jgi:hypothetical protein
MMTCTLWRGEDQHVSTLVDRRISEGAQGLKFRKVEGDERERVLMSRKATGFNYQSYHEVLSGAHDGDVIAVEIADAEGQRGEKIRFSRAARQLNKSLNWLAGQNPKEIVFQVGPMKQKRPREKRV